MEIEGRLIEPTLTRAFGKDRAAIEEMISKLAAMGEGAGVRHHANITLERGTDGKDARSRDLKDQPLPIKKLTVQVGHDLTWRQENGDRRLYVHTVVEEKSTPIYQFELLHSPDGKWSLSGAVRSPRGLTLVFERVQGRPVSDTRSEWAACVLSTKKPARAEVSPPWKIVVDADSPEAALMRLETAGDRGLTGKAGVEFHHYSELKRGFSLGHAMFTSGRGLSKFAGRPSIGCGFLFGAERRADKETTWEGKGEVLIEEGKAAGAIPVVVRNETRIENGYHSEAPNLRNPPEVYLSGVRFSAPLER